MVHGGFLAAAKWITKNAMPSVWKYREEFSAENVVVCGHSMGAGVSALVGMVLKDENPDLDNVFCYCYGCPAVISRELVEFSQKNENIYTFNYNSDLVSHLSYGSLMDFRLMILTASKFVAKSYFLSERNALFAEAMQALTKCREELLKSDVHPKLMSAGVYFQMYPLDPTVPKDKTSNFKWTVLERSEARYHCDMIILPGFISHHIPTRYEVGFGRCIESIERIQQEKQNNQVLPLKQTKNISKVSSDSTRRDISPSCGSSNPRDIGSSESIYEKSSAIMGFSKFLDEED